ncbi:MAG: nucleoside triphosphate pyrophosphohydrolase [Ruminococcaceae bacterium]|nr:nucleoside triphosphate pyrophosphohydrolase [Oscillospiraceae bacterium]
MRYSFQDLIDIIARLRGEGGCPWDAEQTHQSIKKNMIEEAYEATEAIDSGIGAKMADELGDLLLQIVFHAQIGTEVGEFTIEDVTTAVCEKMIRRHPHVFADVVVADSDEVLVNWEEIKKQENGQRTTTESMATVSRYLPALMRASKVQGKAAKVGFDWNTPMEALEKVREEADELSVALSDKSNITEEIGDLLFAAVNTARLAGVDAEEALTAATEKFIRRFSFVESAAKENGKALQEMTLQEMDLLWEESKTNK